MNKKQDSSSTKGWKKFLWCNIAAGAVGLLTALFLPPLIGCNSTGVGSLRHTILLATGGLIAIITLGETRRKNDNENIKNGREHERAVVAARRDRYAQAVEQLGSSTSPVRMGGVYTLVGLADEWLQAGDGVDYTKEKRHREAQNIINNLCAYIRSPFALATEYEHLMGEPDNSATAEEKQKFYTQQAALKAEAEVRLSIIKEIHERVKWTLKEDVKVWTYMRPKNTSLTKVRGLILISIFQEAFSSTP